MIRDLIEQASKEKRVLVTRDAKLLRHGYLIKNQIYRVKSLLKNEQLIEVDPICPHPLCNSMSCLAVMMKLHHLYFAGDRNI